MLLPLPFDVPVDPDAPEAREWLIDELSKQPYQAAKPNLVDLLAQQILQWLGDVIDWLFGNGPAGPTTDVPVWLIAVLVPVVVILIVAFLLYGLPRLNRRSSVTGALFGEDDVRDAASIRRAAERAAAAGDYSTAIAELCRSIARGLAERSLVSTYPGTTAREFGRRAALAFPAESGALETAALDFDGVRYLDRVGTVEQWTAMVALEKRLRTARAVADLETAGAAG
ncbi:MAG: DUF4129 domain-containing protein [Pseudolysinimonas sp.]